MPAWTTRREEAVHFCPVPPKAPPQGQRDGEVEIGVVHHGERVLGAHFHLQASEVLHRGGGDVAAHRDRAGEGDGVDIAAFDQALANLAAGTHDKLEEACRDVLFRDDLGQGDGGGGREVGRFPDDGVAVGERRGDLPRGGGGGEVPRGYDGDGADGFAAHVDLHSGAHGVGVLTDLAQDFVGGIGEELPGAVDLALALGEGFALFARQQRAQFLGAGHEFGADGHEHGLAAFEAVGGPLGLRGAGRGNGLVQLRGAGLGEMTDQIGEVRGIAVFDGRGPFGPLARDVVQLEVGHCASLEFDWRSVANAAIQGKRKVL